MKNIINHSGGCPGADMTWEMEGDKYGVHTIAYSFPKHIQEGKNPKILNTSELLEGWENVKKAEAGLHRPLFRVENNPYVRNLLCRNWFQVKNAESIYAIGKFENESHTIVSGGTGWAVQMAINNIKPIYFFDQILNEWYSYSYIENKFTKTNTTSIHLTENFAGIGTREINENGITAIKEILQRNISIVK